MYNSLGYVGYYGGQWLLIIAAMLIGLISQSVLNGTFNKYSKIMSKNGYTGAQTAEKILSARAYSTAVQRVNGRLSDHFDPRHDTVNLSDSIYGSNSIAAIGVAAHECGHVMQEKEGYAPIKLRTALVPVVNVSQQLGMPLLIIGLLIGFLNLAYLGVALFSFAVIFQLVTLPVEFNASARAVDTLQAQGIITADEVPAVRKVLMAAAFTYVAATLASILQLLRFLLMVRGRDRR